MSEKDAKENSKESSVKTYDISMQRAEKSPVKIEALLTKILDKGKLIAVNQLENPATGRVHFSLVMDESVSADTSVKVFRAVHPEEMEGMVNELLEESTYKLQTWSVSSKSNFLTKCVFIKRKK